jgi:hypothetical protein
MPHNIDYNIIILSTVFNTKDPLFIEDLSKALREAGYIIPESLSMEYGKFQIEDKRIASGKEFDILYDPTVAALFTVSESPKGRYKEFEKLNKIVSDLGVDLDEILRSYELIIEANIKTKVDPQKAINNYFKECQSNVFSNLINEESKNFSINLVQEKGTPENKDWHDLLIRPLSKRHYLFKLVYRRHNLDSFKEKADNIEEIMDQVSEILTKLEGKKK